MSLTQLKEAAASTQIATDGDIDALSAGIVDNENRIIALEEALGNVESMNWLDIDANYVCPENVIVAKLHPVTNNLTITLPSHSVGKKVMVLLSGVTTTITASSGKILTRGGGEASSVTISNRGEYEYVSDGVNWIDQSSASQLESESVEFLDSNASPLRASYKPYVLNANLDFYLPNTTNLKKGDTVQVEAARGVNPPRVVTHTSTVKINSSSGEGTTLTLDVPMQRVSFYWTTWEWLVL